MNNNRERMFKYIVRRMTDMDGRQIITNLLAEALAKLEPKYNDRLRLVKDFVKPERTGSGRLISAIIHELEWDQRSLRILRDSVTDILAEKIEEEGEIPTLAGYVRCKDCNCHQIIEDELEATFITEPMPSPPQQSPHSPEHIRDFGPENPKSRPHPSK